MKGAPRAATVIAAVLCASMLGSAPAAAQCPLPYGADAALASRSTAERMGFIVERARSAEEATRTWTMIFSLGYVGLVTVQMGLIVFVSDPGQRIDFGVGAVGSVIGVASIAVFRSPVLGDRAAIEALAPPALGGDCEALARAERLLEADAASEDFGTSWLIHVGNVVFNLGIGLVLGLGFDRWISGAISAGVGILVGELQILTKPARMLDALRRYRTGELDDAPETAMQIVPMVSPNSVALAWSARF